MANLGTINPNLDLIKKDEFYLFYEMMVSALKTDNVKEGINKSLYMLKTFLNSSNVILFTQKDSGDYAYKVSDIIDYDMIHSVNCIVNKTKPLIERNKHLHLDLDLSERLKNVFLLSIKIEEYNCILAIVNNNKKDLEPHFWDRVNDTMRVILKRSASYEKNTKAISTDLLTGLDNRNSYEIRKSKINEADGDLIVAVFDLFSLKAINDNYSHSKGDEYIKAAAEVLKKYWPKQNKSYSDNHGDLYYDTGHCVYRYGGDEFVLLTTKEDLKLASIKAQLAAEEARMIDLHVDEPVIVGLNYGIAKHKPGDKYKTTFNIADEAMQEDKKKMYIKHNLERRKA